MSDKTKNILTGVAIGAIGLWLFSTRYGAVTLLGGPGAYAGKALEIVPRFQGF